MSIFELLRLRNIYPSLFNVGVPFALPTSNREHTMMSSSNAVVISKGGGTAGGLMGLRPPAFLHACVYKLLKHADKS